MRRRNPNVSNPNELLVGAHTQISVEGSKPEENKLDGNTVVVRICDRLIGIVITLPSTLLKIDA